MNEARFTVEEVIAAIGADHHAPDRGRSGEVCASVGTDTRTAAKDTLFVALVGEHFDAHDFLDAALDAGAWGVVVERGRAGPAEGRVQVFEVDDTLVALGDLARAHRRRFDIPVIAITGSNGKTTTKELTAAAMTSAFGEGLHTEGNLNNLIGVPLTLFRLTGLDRFAVIEMGMNARGEIARLMAVAEPTLGLVTNTAEVHLEGLGSLEGVADAKAELYDGLPDGAVAIVNRDDPRLVVRAEAAAEGGRLDLVGFGTREDADVRLGKIEVSASGTLRFDVAYSERFGGELHPVVLSLLGVHNALNACAALAVVASLGGDLAAAEGGVGATLPVGRRLRQSQGPGGALVLDDCYNANLQSMAAALATARQLAEARGGRLLAALGDMLELGTHEEEQHRRLGHLAENVDRLVAFGPRSAGTAESARTSGVSEVLHTDDASRAVDFLADHLTGEDVILVKGSRGMKMERIVEGLEQLDAAALATVGSDSRGGRQ